MFDFFKRKPDEKTLIEVLNTIKQINRDLNYGGNVDERTVPLAKNKVNSLIGNKNLKWLDNTIIARHFERLGAGQSTAYQEEMKQAILIRDLLMNSNAQTHEGVFDLICDGVKNIRAERQEAARVLRESRKPNENKPA